MNHIATPAKRQPQSPDTETPERQAASWREENREAIASSNAWVEKHGLPLAQFRQF